MSLGTLLIVVLVVLAVVLVAGLVVATRVKRRIDTDKPVAVRVRRTITVSPACIAPPAGPRANSSSGTFGNTIPRRRRPIPS